MIQRNLKPGPQLRSAELRSFRCNIRRKEVGKESRLRIDHNGVKPVNQSCINIRGNKRLGQRGYKNAKRVSYRLRDGVITQPTEKMESSAYDKCIEYY